MKALERLNNRINRILDKWIEKLSKIVEGHTQIPAPTEPTPDTPSNPDQEPTPTPDTGDAVSYNDLDFCWGGFNKKTAKVAANIKNLSVKSDGFTYEWAAGGCESLGAENSTDASKTLSCFFCKIDGKWKGGKHDYISTSRKSRDFKNIRDGYNGWDKGAIEKSTEYALVIVSIPKSLRTNVISCKKK